MQTWVYQDILQSQMLKLFFCPVCVVIKIWGMKTLYGEGGVVGGKIHKLQMSRTFKTIKRNAKQYKSMKATKSFF